MKEKVLWVDILKGGLYSIVVVWAIWLLFTKVLGLMLPAGRLI
ncbi:MAG: hypothetical protein N2250_04530 [Pseudothermotoga sp.]|nr:hypothetical protein [Pseudothermotoga sp.]MCX7812901.1 hypothetical protein [Pseudothermotoga sp.]MDW8139860.1 hypothetical protein [Pseudothermotoga sp.]